MGQNIHFDALIVVTPQDCERLMPLYPRLVDKFPYGNICFIGRDEVGEIAKSNAAIADRVDWVDENSIVPFDEVHACMANRLKDILNGEPLSRGVTGWYYQQFLKMQYAFTCKDEYYMVWDGDTVPCRTINMFNEQTGQPFLDLKHEYHPEYFETMGKLLPGFKKVIERSFISEHMLMRKDIMISLINDIEKNDSIEGTRFWEKIINCIEPEKIFDSSFSEFETYGTYVALKYPDVYRLREWHSFRLGGSFFDINTICDRDFEWLAKDFDAISFEKGQDASKENFHFFDNPEYQQKLSAKRMLQIAQMEYKDGYKEVWEDDIQVAENANVREGGYHTSKNVDTRTVIVVVSFNGMYFMQENINSIRKELPKDSYKLVVVDNASTDGVTQWLEQQEDIILIKNSENVGFGPACNQGVKATIGTEFENCDVLLLNNDTRMVFDALYFLRQALYSADDIGAVGSISNKAGNKQSIDISFDKVEDYISYGEKINVPMKNASLEKVRLSGFAMLIRRKVWNEIGGFDEDFVPGYFEDDALSMEILKKGYRLELVRNSFIYHSGTESFSKVDFNEYVNKNYNLFKEKYGFDILKYAYASGTAISLLPYGESDSFSVLHYGCGLGAELKAIRSLFPNAELTGIETKSSLFEIVRKTENVYGSLDELLEFVIEPTYNVLIIEKNVLENLDPVVVNLLSGLLQPGASVIVKNMEYEEFPYENIKLIVWGMNDTFWQGVISEGEVILPLYNVELVANIVDHGVMNSILAREDAEKVISELENGGAYQNFVFNDVGQNVTPEKIKEKIEAMNLEESEVMYIDSNPANLDRAKSVCKGIFAMGPDIIPYLNTYFVRSLPSDKDHENLEHYKILEKKTGEKNSAETGEQFLEDSKITITVNRNCAEELDAIFDLVTNSNQLNYTKVRDSKEYLLRLIGNDWNDCAYICARDKYGDYGIVGFYCYNLREKRMEHFLFSHKVVGMGIEQYIYEKIGSPQFPVEGKVSSQLVPGKKVSWITEDKASARNISLSGKKRLRILLKGSRDLLPVEMYLGGADITSEYGPDSEHDGLTKLFDGEYQVICYSLIGEITKDTDLGAAFEKLDDMYDRTVGKPLIILLLGSETEYKEGGEEARLSAEAYREVNPVLTEFAQDHRRMRVINVTDFIHSQDDFKEECDNFSDSVYYKVAGQISDYVNEVQHL